MSQTERHYKIHHLLALGKCLGKQRRLNELGVSPATLKRDLAHLRGRLSTRSKAELSALFEQNGQRLGIRSDPPKMGEHTDALLPGLGYSADEIAALRAVSAVA